MIIVLDLQLMSGGIDEILQRSISGGDGISTEGRGGG